MHNSTKQLAESQRDNERHQLFIRSVVTTPDLLAEILGGTENAGWFYNAFHGVTQLKSTDDKAAYQIAYEIVSEKAHELMEPIPERPNYNARKETMIDIALCIGAVAAVAVAIKLGFFW